MWKVENNHNKEMYVYPESQSDTDWQNITTKSAVKKLKISFQNTTDVSIN